MRTDGTDLVSLQSAQIHHVVTQFRDLRHQINGFLREPGKGTSSHLRSVNRRLKTMPAFYLDLITVHACLAAELQEVLKRTWYIRRYIRHSKYSSYYCSLSIHLMLLNKTYSPKSPSSKCINLFSGHK